ncbi:MAG TPA: hypothetical protein VGQ17_02220, partial [Gemmatimonadales bacterium]|nr:hypothetical protein [Gemmatimonadales bacterium]
MLIRRPPDILSRDITDERLFWSRRDWLASVGLGLAGSAVLTRLARAAAAPGDELTPTPYDWIT